MLFIRLGDSLANWQQLPMKIKARSAFDTSDTQKSFGVCVIDYEQVQARVNAKHDSLQRDILSRFGVKLGNAMKEMHASILKARNDLEHHSISFNRRLGRPSFTMFALVTEFLVRISV
jgi:hypothetical protein